MVVGGKSGKLIDPKFDPSWKHSNESVQLLNFKLFYGIETICFSVMRKRNLLRKCFEVKCNKIRRWSNCSKTSLSGWN